MENYVKKNLITIDNYELILYMFNDNGIYSFKTELFSNNEIVDKAETMGITNDRNKADYIYNLLVRESVFPSHLFYVIDEIIV